MPAIGVLAGPQSACSAGCQDVRGGIVGGRGKNQRNHCEYRDHRSRKGELAEDRDNGGRSAIIGQHRGHRKRSGGLKVQTVIAQDHVKHRCAE